MSLTIEVEPSINTAVYNPVRFEFNSDVTSDYTIGAEIEAQDGQSNYNGYLQINLVNEHFLLVGDFILISQNAGIDQYNGVWLVTELIDDTQFVINAPYVGSGTSNIWYYKYLRNYNAVIRVFGYFNCIANYGLLAKVQLKPYFVDGYCYFSIDISDILKDFNTECNTTEGMTSNLFPLVSPPTIQTNSQSFIKYYISYAEGFDNPVGTDAEYIETPPSDL
jgi:hypothetical protein